MPFLIDNVFIMIDYVSFSRRCRCCMLWAISYSLFPSFFHCSLLTLMLTR